MNFRNPLIAITTAAALLTAAPGAHALVDLTSSYHGLTAFDGPSAVGRIFNGTGYEKVNLVARKANDDRGDRLQVQGHVQDSLPANGLRVYAQGTSFNDGDYCYVSGISVDGDGGMGFSLDCTQGWHRDASYDFSRYVPADSQYYQFVFRYPRSATMNSQRMELRVCQDEPLWLSDTCSGTRVVGIDWN